MSWTDIKSLEQIKKLRDRFNIKVFVETGTFRGNNAEVHASNFETVLTVESLQEFYWKAKHKVFSYPNVFPVLGNSPDFLKEISSYLKNTGTIFFYLDAHFYDATLPAKDRWVVLKELRALEGFNNCVIAIHDFKCNGLGHLIYDGQSLDFELVQDAISKVNPNFNYYFNQQSGCDIITEDKVRAGKVPNTQLNPDVVDTIDFVWSAPETIHRAYRGILYATPEPIDLSQFDLRETR
jgi:hypothetical protein